MSTARFLSAVARGIAASCCLLHCIALPAFAHTLRGSAENAETNEPAPFTRVEVLGTSRGAVADANGFFTISGLAPGTHVLRATNVGFESADVSVTVAEGAAPVDVHFHLKPVPIALEEVVVSAERSQSAASSRRVRELDLKLRPRETPHDMLELVPGLVVAQHAGGGKAEQIFLRGFDADHGTDVAIDVDGIPVNMVSHGHGQGYADLHFLIPEVVEAIEVDKGPYFARRGDFSTAGAVTYTTRDRVERTEITSEGGAWNTGKVTVVAPVPLESRGTSAYLATSAFTSEGPFEASQDFRRLNVFGKAMHRLSDASSIEFAGSSFSSTWRASGQVPHRAVDSGLIERFGTLDDEEGGGTSRTDFRFAYRSRSEDDRRRMRIQAWSTDYDFRLYSNFTFFLADTTNGDSIEQTDDRRVIGLSAEHESRHDLAGRATTFLLGAATRVDRTDVALWRNRVRERLEPVKIDRVRQTNPSLYGQSSLELAPRAELVLGLRADFFTFDVDDLLEDLGTIDPDRSTGSSGVVGDGILSPKASLVLRPTDRLDVFLNSGLGFHSNDARSVIAAPDSVHLPRAKGAEIGARARVGSRLNVGVAAWRLDLEREVVWVGDGGEPEFSGETRRYGVDLEARAALFAWLFADADVNLSRGRATGDDVEPGADRIPLAPRVTSTGGLTWEHTRGWFGTARYRHVGERPANETGSVRAEGHTLFDASMGRRFGPWSIELVGENLADEEWNEAQFDTESRIRLADGTLETDPVSELHFTPGNPFNVRVRAGVQF